MTFPIEYAYRLDKIFPLRRTIKLALLTEINDETIQGDVFRKLVDSVQQLLPGNIQRAVIEDSLRSSVGKKATPEIVDEMAWRMAGNYQRLKQRRAVPPWHVQKIAEWVPTQIVSCRREQNNKGTLGATFGFKALAGTSCTRTIPSWWSLKFARFYAPEFGFGTQARGDREIRFPYMSPEQLVGTRAYVQVTPELSNREPGFKIFGIPPVMKKWNTALVKKRFRATTDFRCALKLPVDYPCHRCPAGFSTCEAATHRKDWVKKKCPVCERPDAWFDPGVAGDVAICVDCAMKKSYEKKK